MGQPALSACPTQSAGGGHACAHLDKYYTGNLSSRVEQAVLLYTCFRAAWKAMGACSGLAVGLAGLTNAVSLLMLIPSGTQLAALLCSRQPGAKPSTCNSLLHGLLGLPCLLVALTTVYPGAETAAWAAMTGSCSLLLFCWQAGLQLHWSTDTNTPQGKRSSVLLLLLKPSHFTIAKVAHSAYELLIRNAGPLLHAGRTMPARILLPLSSLVCSAINTSAPYMLAGVLAYVPATFTLGEAMLVTQCMLVSFLAAVQHVLSLTSSNPSSDGTSSAGDMWDANEAGAAASFCLLFTPAVTAAAAAAWLLSCRTSAVAAQQQQGQCGSYRIIRQAQHIAWYALWAVFLSCAIPGVMVSSCWVLLAFLPGWGTAHAAKLWGFSSLSLMPPSAVIPGVASGSAVMFQNQSSMQPWLSQSPPTYGHVGLWLGAAQAQLSNRREWFTQLLQACRPVQQAMQRWSWDISWMANHSVLLYRLLVLLYWALLLAGALLVQAWLATTQPRERANSSKSPTLAVALAADAGTSGQVKQGRGNTKSLSPGVQRIGSNSDSKQQRQGHQQNQQSDGVQASGKTTCSKVPLIIVRKGYHLIALLLLVPVLHWDPNLLMVSLSIAWALLLLLEVVRARHMPWLGDKVHAFMSRFVDERDAGAMYTTHLALLLGLAMPVWLSAGVLGLDTTHVMCSQESAGSVELTQRHAGSHSGPLCQALLRALCSSHESGRGTASLPLAGRLRHACSDVLASTIDAQAMQVGCVAGLQRMLAPWWLVATAGFVSIGVGDAVASVVGKLFGRRPLHTGTRKTWEGSLAGCLSMAVCAVWVMSGSTGAVRSLSWRFTADLLIHIVLATVLEAVTDQLDNLVVPLWHTTWMLSVCASHLCSLT